MGPLSYIFFFILGNAARCALLKIPQIANEDDIRVLFFHYVLSTIQTYTTQHTPEVHT